MKCVEFQNRLNELLDQQFDPRADVELQDHRQQCIHCEHWMSVQCSIINLVSHSDRFKVTGSSVHWAASDRQGVTWVVALASMIMLSASLAIGVSARLSVRPSLQSVVAGDRMTGTSRVSSEWASALRRSHDGPASRETWSTGGAWPAIAPDFLSPPLIGLGHISNEWKATPDALLGSTSVYPSTQLWVDQLSDEMRPVQQSLSSTLRLLRRSVTPGLAKTAS